MDILLLLLILGVFILPSFFMMRSQRRRQAEVQKMQNSVQSGARVVSVSGMHGTVQEVRDNEIDLEISPGVSVTMDKVAILRTIEPETAPVDDLGMDFRDNHPENYDGTSNDSFEPRNPEDNR